MALACSSVNHPPLSWHVLPCSESTPSSASSFHQANWLQPSHPSSSRSRYGDSTSELTDPANHCLPTFFKQNTPHFWDFWTWCSRARSRVVVTAWQPARWTERNRSRWHRRRSPRHRSLPPLSRSRTSSSHPRFGRVCTSSCSEAAQLIRFESDIFYHFRKICDPKYYELINNAQESSFSFSFRKF